MIYLFNHNINNGFVDVDFMEGMQGRQFGDKKMNISVNFFSKPTMPMITAQIVKE